MVTSRVLDSGTRVLLESVPESDVVSVGFWLLRGSRDESEGQSGYSHFLEHMLFKGTHKRSALQIAQDVDRVGGIINAFTEKENICFYCIVPRTSLALALEVLTDMIFESTLDPVELEREKSVVVNEIRSYLDSPEECAFELYMTGLWGKHPLARKVTGEVGDVQAISRDSLEDFYRTNFTPQSISVSVAGGFEEAATLGLLEEMTRRADGRPTGQISTAQRQPPDRNHDRSFVRKRFKQDQIYVGTDFESVRGRQELIYSSLVFSTAVGESMSSRLFQELRERRGLCYSIGSFRTLYSDTSLWSVYANTTPEQSGKLLHALDGELARLTTEPLTAEEIEDAKAHLQGSLILSKADMDSRMKRLVQLHGLFGRTLEFEESLANLQAVTEESVHTVATRLLKDRNFNLMAYGGRKITGLKNLRLGY